MASISLAVNKLCHMKGITPCQLQVSDLPHITKISDEINIEKIKFVSLMSFLRWQNNIYLEVHIIT